VTPVDGNLTAWPALFGVKLPARISYERGIWGKLNGARADYKWIATTPSFTAGGVGIEKELQLGSEDTPRKATHWRSLEEQGLAVACYPSPSVDTSGRSSFLEKQVFAWRRRDSAPAALGALALLPRVARTNAAIWWDRRTQSWSEDDDSTLVLTPEDHEALSVDLQELAATAAAGLAELGRTVSEEALIHFYAHLLADHRGVSLGKLQAPLSPEALAALLLPLPRPLADRLSLAGWLPSQRIPDPAELRRCWNGTLGGLSLPSPPPEEPSRELREKARTLAQSILAGNPLLISPRPARPAAAGRHPFKIALWGPASAGKTALLAQLYLGNSAGGQGSQKNDWEPFWVGASQDFFNNMRSRMRSENLFPSATVLTPTGERIEYRFRHRSTGVEVLLHLEDRAGDESEKLTEAIRRHLAEADGILFLFDPYAQGTTLHDQIWRALEYLNPDVAGERAPIDNRPVAVCLSKADLLIRTVEDLHRARTDPGGFVRRYDRMDLTRLLEKFCGNYQFFPVSAAGLRVEYGVVESVVFYDETLRPRLAPGGTPLHVMSPFAWLLDQVVARRS
jgi:GTPase SAR1 family protein